MILTVIFSLECRIVRPSFQANYEDIASHDMGPRNEVNAKTVNWNSDGGDKEDELNKYRISSGDNLFLPTRGVADV